MKIEGGKEERDEGLMKDACEGDEVADKNEDELKRESTEVMLVKEMQIGGEVEGDKDIGGQKIR